MSSLHASHHPVTAIQHEPVVISACGVVALEDDLIERGIRQPRVFIHAADPTVVVQHGRDGADYARVCFRHGWASEWINSMALLSSCINCAAELEGRKGKERYAVIHARMAVGR